ncbi:50S ribosomal protein L22 [Candidatus Falkowbacteria bacterium]|jgi:large subunit ribosomal protein L22|nr:50S ribosomal protein L22 [Candidatus Falkowbacteria bacterium]
MIIKATQKNTRQTPLKVRLVANSVKKLSLVDAIKQLAAIERKSTLVILKVLRTAIANAIHNHGFAFEDLTIKSITVAPAPKLKRFRAVSRGRAHTIFKRTCHVTVELEAGEGKKPAVKPKKVVKPSTKAKAKVEKNKTVLPAGKVNRKVMATKKAVTKASNIQQKKGQAK